MVQRIGLFGPGSVIDDPTYTPGGWETALLYPPPAGWELWPKVYVPPTGDAVTGYDTTAKTSGGQNEPNYPPCVVSPPSGVRNFVVIMPRPGDWKGHTTGQYRKGAVYLMGGDNVVFATERADRSLRRGGFVIEMPRFAPFPTPYPWNGKASGQGFVDDDTKQTFVLNDDASVKSDAIVDITGFYLRGRVADNLDAGEGITGGTRRIVQVQRYRCEGIHGRCGADEAGSSGNDGVGIQPGYTSNSAYAQLDSWTHCDGFQIWKDGLGELRMHDVTIESGFGCFMMPTKAGALAGLKTPAQVFGDLYLSRVNMRSSNEAYPETGTGTGNVAADYPSTYTGTIKPLNQNVSGVPTLVCRNYLNMGGTLDASGQPTIQIQACSPKHVYCAEGTVYMQRPSNERPMNSCFFPNGSSGTTWRHVDLSNYTAGAWNAEGMDGTDADDMWVSFTSNVHGNTGERLHCKWNGTWDSTKAVDITVAGKVMVGLPLIGGVRRDYVPASRWGSAPDWNEYEE